MTAKTRFVTGTNAEIGGGPDLRDAETAEQPMRGRDAEGVRDNIGILKRLIVAPRGCTVPFVESVDAEPVINDDFGAID